MVEESLELDLVSMLNGLVQDPTNQKAVNNADLLLQVALSAEIRDLDWPPTIYEVLWEVLHVCWKRIILGTTPTMLESLCHVETAIWRTFKAISTFPEYNCSAATTENPRLNVDLVQTLLLRSLRVDSDHSRNTTKQCIHWLYQNRVDVRPLIRTGIYETNLLHYLTPSLTLCRISFDTYTLTKRVVHTLTHTHTHTHTFTLSHINF